jgi:hypothetical protein
MKQENSGVKLPAKLQSSNLFIGQTSNKNIYLMEGSLIEQRPDRFGLLRLGHQNLLQHAVEEDLAHLQAHCRETCLRKSK